MVLNFKRGGGLLNKLINNLPFEAHFWGYNFCGSGTKLEKRLARGDTGINPLDNYCKEHDIAYAKNTDVKTRHVADRILADKAWSRVSASDAKLGEKIAAYAVTNAMKAKVKLGMGIKKKTRKTSNKKMKKKRGASLLNSKLKSKIGRNRRGRGRRVTLKKSKHLRDAVSAAKNVLRKSKSKDIKVLVSAALKASRKAIKGSKKESIKRPRIIPIPKSGGALQFLIPLFAGLSAIGSLAGGATAIYKAVNEAKNAKKESISYLKITSGRKTEPVFRKNTSKIWNV